MLSNNLDTSRRQYMYAVFQLSGSQFSAEEGAIVRVPVAGLAKGSKLNITEVLLVKDSANTLIGHPYVAGAKVQAEVVDSGKADKVRIYKYRRRTKYRRRQGHRQPFSDLKINKIVLPTK
jgi:large subunit ribosomal protein L21